MTNILFYSSMLSPREVEPDCIDEYAAAKAAGAQITWRPQRRSG
jgi:hypothetical protein